jgi:hypothetical protein
MMNEIVNVFDAAIGKANNYFINEMRIQMVRKAKNHQQETSH